MSIKFNVSSLSNEQRLKMANDLVVTQKETQYRKNPAIIYPYSIDDNGNGSFPYAYTRNMNIKPNKKYLKSSLYTFVGKLREEQQLVRAECIKYLNETGSGVLSMYPGFGKTAIAIELAQRIGLKTLIIVNRIVLLKQWCESIEKFCPLATINCLYSSIEETDFRIVNAINVEKIPKSILESFGLVIVDECHMIVTETLYKGLITVHPKYLLGLSATPYRSDGMDILIDLYFGTNKIIRKLNRKHIVYVINTGFTPVMKIARNNKPDWNSVVESQSLSPLRVNIIKNIINKFKNRKFLILCKRIEQATMIVNAIEEPTSTLFGDKQEYNKNNRILVATVQKAGVGFDDSSIDALILASDIQEYFIQYLGRCMRTPEVIPLIFDLVDNNPILSKHYIVRKKVYTESGGEIKVLKI